MTPPKMGNASQVSYQDISHSFISKDTTNFDRTIQEPNNSTNNVNQRPNNNSQQTLNMQNLTLNSISGYAPPPRNFRSSSKHTKQPHLDRFITKMNHPVMKHNRIAEACGVKVDRVLDFNRRRQPNFDPLSQLALPVYQPPNHTRAIPTKPKCILDAPGIVNDFYNNTMDWSQFNDCVAVGLANSVYTCHPITKAVNEVAAFDNEEVSCCKWQDSQSTLAVSTNTGRVYIYDVASQKKVRTLRGRQHRVATLSWNQQLLSSGSKDGHIWNHDFRIKNHKIASMHSHYGEVCGLEWRADGNMLASGGNDNNVNLYDARQTSSPHLQLHAHQAAVKALRWCPWYTNLLATGGGRADKRVHFWNTANGQITKSLELDSQVTALHWNTEHKEIIASLGNTYNGIQVFSYPSLHPVAQIELAHEDRILSSCLNGDQSTLLTAGADEKIKFWTLNESQVRKTRTQPALLLGRI